MGFEFLSNLSPSACFLSFMLFKRILPFLPVLVTGKVTDPLEKEGGDRMTTLLDSNYGSIYLLSNCV